MDDVSAVEHRLVYSLLKPAVRVAARFRLPIRKLTELLRLAYFETLSRDQKLSIPEIASRFGQTERHMRSLAHRLQSDFFAPEEVGLGRQIEASIAAESPTFEELAKRFAARPPQEVREALSALIEEGRVRETDGRFVTTQQYVVLRSDKFHHRIDALNHFLEGALRAVLHRLVYDDRQTSMVKTLSFAARADRLMAFIARLEGDLRRDIAAIDEQATFDGHGDEQFTLGIILTPATDQPREEGSQRRQT